MPLMKRTEEKLKSRAATNSLHCIIYYGGDLIRDHVIKQGSTRGGIPRIVKDRERRSAISPTRRHHLRIVWMRASLTSIVFRNLFSSVVVLVLVNESVAKIIGLRTENAATVAKQEKLDTNIAIVAENRAESTYYLMTSIWNI